MAAAPGGSDVAVSGSSGSREAGGFRREAAEAAATVAAAAEEAVGELCRGLYLGNPGGPGLGAVGICGGGAALEGTLGLGVGDPSGTGPLGLRFRTA